MNLLLFLVESQIVLFQLHIIFYFKQECNYDYRINSCYRYKATPVFPIIFVHTYGGVNQFILDSRKFPKLNTVKTVVFVVAVAILTTSINSAKNN